MSALGWQFYDTTSALSIGDYHLALGMRTRSNASRETLGRRMRYGGRKGKRAARRLLTWNVVNGFGGALEQEYERQFPVLCVYSSEPSDPGSWKEVLLSKMNELEASQ